MPSVGVVVGPVAVAVAVAAVLEESANTYQTFQTTRHLGRVVLVVLQLVIGAEIDPELVFG